MSLFRILNTIFKLARAKIVVLSGNEYARINEASRRLRALHTNWTNPRVALELAGGDWFREVPSSCPRLLTRRRYIELLGETQEWEVLSRISFGPNGTNILVNREQAMAYIADLMNAPAQTPEEDKRRAVVCKTIIRLWS